MAQNLFNLSQNAAVESNKPLVSFKAGKCTFANGTVTPINKKGLVQVLQTPDSLLHFQWKDRTTGTIEDDLIIFPEEAQFVRAKPDVRVFLLKFTSGRKLFFWLQEPKDDKDKEYEEKTNQYINNPPSPDSALAGEDAGLQGMDESQLRQMFQGGARNQASPSPSQQTSSSAAPSAPTAVPTAPTTVPTPTPTPTPVTAPITTTPNTSATSATLAPSTSTANIVPNTTPAQPSNPAGLGAAASQEKLSADMAASLSSILANFGLPQAAGQQGEDIDLQEVLIPELVLPLLTSDPEALKELFSHLPAGTQNLAGLRELLFSPQFGQTIDSFTHVVNSGHANSLMRMFGFDPMLAGPVGVMDVNSFITALRASIEKNSKK